MSQRMSLNSLSPSSLPSIMKEQIPDFLSFLSNISESPVGTTHASHVKPASGFLTAQEFLPLLLHVSAKPSVKASSYAAALLLC